MSKLSDLVQSIEVDYGAARRQSSHIALSYIQRAYEEGWTVGSKSVQEVFGRRLPDAHPDPRRVDFLARYSFDAIKNVEGLGVERVRAIMQRASDDATMDPQDIAHAVESEFNGVVENFRLPLIARVESNRAGNAAKLDRYMATPVVEYVQIVTAEDGRVRSGPTGNPPSPADHASVDGQVRPKGEPFDIPRFRDYGGNGNGDRYPPFDPGCRCTIVPYLPDSQLARASLSRVPEWDRAMGAYAHAMTLDLRRAWRSAFDRVAATIHAQGHAALEEVHSSR